VIGPYDRPRVRLPGAGGAPEIASSAGEVIVMLRQSPRTFVESVDFVSSVGFGRNGEGRAGHRGGGPTVVITDLGVLRPDPETHQLELVAVHPGIDVDSVVAASGWDLLVAADLGTVEQPTEEELTILRDLKERTSLAHKTVL
jgi:glutaconate CoA-transferase, subunit B